MSLYDGNQLPENPTSQFQLAVSIIYTLMMCFYMSMGGFAAWATQKQLTPPADSPAGGLGPSGLRHPTQYMSDLVHKRNSICRGLLAFIPAAYTLTHLYASTLHSSSLYSSSNIIFGAAMGYAAFFTGKTLQQLVVDSDHMDTTKAVYETLYMLAAGLDRLRVHKVTDADKNDKSIFASVNEANPWDGGPGREPAWRHPWVLFNVFLAIGAQDDARIWCMFTSWIRKFRESSLTAWLPAAPTFYRGGDPHPFLGEVEDWVAPTWEKVLLGKRWKLFERLLLGDYGNQKCQAASPSSSSSSKTSSKTSNSADPLALPSIKQSWMGRGAYAYWLFSQDKSVRTITGSMVVKQGIVSELELAGCRSKQLYFAAVAFIDVLSKHVKRNLDGCLKSVELVALSFITETGEEIKFEDLVECLQRIYHKEQIQALNMITERYVCRLTPNFASLCLPTNMLVPRLFDCWGELFKAAPTADLLTSDPGYWCHLWLTYMQMVLIGVDLLRMHNNKPFFKDTKCEAGSFCILEPKQDNAAAQAPSAAAHTGTAAQSTGGHTKVLRDEVLEQLSTTAAGVKTLAKATEDASIQYSALHDLSDGDLYSLAAFVATLLLKYRMHEEGLSAVTGNSSSGNSGSSATSGSSSSGGGSTTTSSSNEAPKFDLGIKDTKNLKQVKLHNSDLFTYRTMLLGAGFDPGTSFYGDYLQTRAQLVNSHTSLPAIVEGVECMSASEWMDRVMGPLTLCVIFAALAAAVVANIACSNGVFLVTLSGAVQALCAWVLLWTMDLMPRQPKDVATRPRTVWERAVISVVRFLFAVLDLILRPLWLLLQLLHFASFINANWWCLRFLGYGPKSGLKPLHKEVATSSVAAPREVPPAPPSAKQPPTEQPPPVQPPTQQEAEQPPPTQLQAEQPPPTQQLAEQPLPPTQQLAEQPRLMQLLAEQPPPAEQPAAQQPLTQEQAMQLPQAQQSAIQMPPEQLQAEQQPAPAQPTHMQPQPVQQHAQVLPPKPADGARPHFIVDMGRADNPAGKPAAASLRARLAGFLPRLCNVTTSYLSKVRAAVAAAGNIMWSLCKRLMVGIAMGCVYLGLWLWGLAFKYGEWLWQLLRSLPGWLWGPYPVTAPPSAVDEAATALAVAVTVAATVKQSADAAREIQVGTNADDHTTSDEFRNTVDLLLADAVCSADHTSDSVYAPEAGVHVCSVFQGAIAVEAATILESAGLWVLPRSSPPPVQPAAQPVVQHGGQPIGQPTAQQSEQPTTQPTTQPTGQPTGPPTTQQAEQQPRRFANASKGGLGATSQRYLYSTLLCLYTIRCTATFLLLHLSRARVGLISCFEKSKRHCYSSRIRTWNVTVKAAVPLFMYGFFVLILLAVLQEPWYTGGGMCYSRCLNRTDCQVNTTVGLVSFDNALQRWVDMRELRNDETVRGNWSKAPPCPGVGALVTPDSEHLSDGLCGCPWLAQVVNIKVNAPNTSHVSLNGTVCVAQVHLKDNFKGLPPAVGTAVPGVWYSMTDGQNDNSSQQAGDRVVALTDSRRVATFTSPLGKPFNRSDGHGCNLTVLAPDTSAFAVHPSSVLHNSTSWGRVKCKGDWVPTSPCDAMCESYGTQNDTYVVSVRGSLGGADCEEVDGKNRTVPCGPNNTLCNCTGYWQETRGCDAKCESTGTKTMTYIITKPAMSRMVGSKLVPGAPCPAKHLQTKEELCENNTNCTLNLHADVSADSGQVVHADLVTAKHARP